MQIKRAIFILNIIYSMSVSAASFHLQLLSGDEQNGSMSNSVVIIGKNNVLLVDTQRSELNAKKVVAFLKSTGKKLETVFITHGHPDHFLGASVIQKAFPEAKFVASPSVALEIQKNGESIRAKISEMMVANKSKDKIPDTIVFPEAITSGIIRLEGEDFKIIDANLGESESAAMLLLTQEKTLIAGDVVYHGVHLWLHDGRFEQWISLLEKLMSMKEIETIYPGHGGQARFHVLNQNMTYIQDFRRALTMSKNAKDLIEIMKKSYPHFKMKRFLAYGANKLIAELKK